MKLGFKSAGSCSAGADCAPPITLNCLHRYPWWPALVIERQDQRIPQSEWRSTQTATPVLFFGTAEFSWIDASRNVSPWETEKLSRAVKDKSPEFKRVRHSVLLHSSPSNHLVTPGGLYAHAFTIHVDLLTYATRPSRNDSAAPVCNNSVLSHAAPANRAR